MRATPLLGLLLALTAVARAERLPLTTYTTADGLPHSRVRHVLRDSRGFLWFCTRDGVSRFDGHNFTTYGAERNPPIESVNHMLETRDGTYWIATNGGGVIRFNPLGQPQAVAPGSQFTAYPVGGEPATNRVNVLYQDRAGRLWAGTDGGLFLLEETDGEAAFRRVELGLPSRPDELVQVWAFHEDAEGSLWIGSKLGLLRRLPDGRLIQHLVRPSATSDHVLALLADTEGRLWLGHESGLIEFKPLRIAEGGLRDERVVTTSLNPQAALRDPQPGEARRYTSADGVPDDRVLKLFQSADGRIWVGTSKSGLVEFKDGRFRTYTTAQGLNDDHIESLGEDGQGSLWIGTGNGVMRLARSNFLTYGVADGLGERVGSLIETRAGELWVTSSDFLLSRLEGNRFATFRFNLPRQITGWRPTVTLQDHTGQWWVATGGGLYRFPAVRQIEQLARAQPLAVYTTKDGLAGNDPSRLYEDARGDIWISTFAPVREVLTRWERATGTFHRYSDVDGLRPFIAPQSFGEDGAGNLWIGFWGGGVARYRAGRFTIFTEADGLPTTNSKIIYIDRARRLWIGTASGLCRIDDPAAEQPRAVLYTTADGLASNQVNALTEDLRGRIYIVSNRGIDRLDPATGHVKHYTADDGVSHTEFTIAYRDRQGTLWFSGVFGGLLRFVPEAGRPATPPPVLIGGLRVAGEARPMSELGETEVAQFELGPTQNHVEIDFFGLDFGSGEALRFEHRLEGLDENWSAPTGQRTANYASLSPGAYCFLVRAISADGTRSQSPATVSFRVLPPLWQRGWFLALAALLVAIPLLAFARYRYARLRALRESENRFRALAESASDAIFTIDEAGRIVFVNPAARAVFGYRQEDLTGAEITKLIPAYPRAWPGWARAGRSASPGTAARCAAGTKAGRNFLLNCRSASSPARAGVISLSSPATSPSASAPRRPCGAAARSG